MSRTVLIVDDHAGFRAHAVALLEQAGYDVAGSCEDGGSALTAIRSCGPIWCCSTCSCPTSMVSG